MKKVLVICCSDVLGIPAILKLKQQNMLAGIATTDKAAPYLAPIFKNLGFADDELHILTKQNIEAELFALIKQYSIDTLLTFTFSWMVPNAVLSALPNRCINFHFGLLPKYAGADPIFWQIYNGEQQSGISIHIMTDQIDNGPLIHTEVLPVFPGENYGLHIQRLGMLAADAVAKLNNMLNGGALTLNALPATLALYFKKPTRLQLTINWQQQSAEQIERLVNAANPRYQGAVTSFRQVQINLLEVAPADVNNPNNEQIAPGTIIHADLVYGIVVACLNNQFLKINVAHMQEGYFSGAKLFSLGFAVGEVFI
jgi:methionyl-tRNA formyltransferase